MSGFFLMTCVINCVLKRIEEKNERKKIIIIGSGGAGKSTLAREVSKQLDIYQSIT